MKDFLLDTNKDLAIANGDILIGFSDKQHQELLLMCNKGSFKETPALCVGIENYLESEDPANLLNEIKRQFVSDGMAMDAIEIKNGKLLIDADYSTA